MTDQNTTDPDARLAFEPLVRRISFQAPNEWQTRTDYLHPAWEVRIYEAPGERLSSTEYVSFCRDRRDGTAEDAVSAVSATYVGDWSFRARRGMAGQGEARHGRARGTMTQPPAPGGQQIGGTIQPTITQETQP